MLYSFCPFHSLLTKAEQWDAVSKQPLFKGGAVRITKVHRDGEVEIHAHEQQSAIVEKVETPAKRTDDSGYAITGEEGEMERYLEYWLGATHASIEVLREICDHLVPRMSHADYEVSVGMKVMSRIVQSCVDKMATYASKYRASAEFGHEISSRLKETLFPDRFIGGFSGSPGYDTLMALQCFYLFIGHVQGHLVTLSPAAQATWDRGFIEAVDFVTNQMDRIVAWTKQQMGSRASQTLLVPCREAAKLKNVFKEELPKKRSAWGERLKTERYGG